MTCDRLVSRRERVNQIQILFVLCLNPRLPAVVCCWGTAGNQWEPNSRSTKIKHDFYSTNLKPSDLIKFVLK